MTSSKRLWLLVIGAAFVLVIMWLSVMLDLRKHRVKRELQNETTFRHDTTFKPCYGDRAIVYTVFGNKWMDYQVIALTAPRSALDEYLVNNLKISLVSADDLGGSLEDRHRLENGFRFLSLDAFCKTQDSNVLSFLHADLDILMFAKLLDVFDIPPEKDIWAIRPGGTFRKVHQAVLRETSGHGTGGHPALRRRPKQQNTIFGHVPNEETSYKDRMQWDFSPDAFNEWELSSSGAVPRRAGDICTGNDKEINAAKILQWRTAANVSQLLPNYSVPLSTDSGKPIALMHFQGGGCKDLMCAWFCIALNAGFAAQIPCCKAKIGPK
ncbi:hypothetical protein M427DRAFT_143443 [Gonapodya prolifera JEL478]|uniref:Uncharacterized protein n=1 Tax=Gonapodya prolifera (strain JEL478) TaxID=1344416 RepID=A0A139AR63_GONPJ|nr:hypothetical protein M427DRAFT_143443 [Gonapodya prolifera JEL478]|eukprot:KXS19226.1 hypothetical protein M427DRAFT_143443 [Gonapodya prolifera JEL478]